MSLFSSSNMRLLAFYLALVIFTCLPIWSVEYYLDQDGSPHLYNGFIILELLKENPTFTSIYAFNPIPIPNLTGHWILTFLLVFFSPQTVIKIIVTLTFALFVAAIGWLRWQIAGREGIYTVLLIGIVLAFNWMWFLGFYNFIIGVIGFTFTLGLYWRWREKLNFYRTFVVAILIIFVFLSHLISFAMLVGSILAIGIFVSPIYLKRTLAWTFAAFTPVIPLIISYKLAAEAGERASPVWRYLENPLSLSNWILQLQTADPFQLLSRKTLPFLSVNSGGFVLFMPLLWLTVALLCFTFATWFYGGRRFFFSREQLPFVLITLLSILFWVFGPDDFGKSHGSFLRERIVLCGLICFVPLCRSEFSPRLRTLGQLCLVFVVLFQTLALWDYSITADKIGREYLSGRQAIADDGTLGAVILIENGCRFKSNPLTNINVLYGIGKNTRVWDNYEIGYYLFPVVVLNPSERQFVFDFHESSVYDLCDPNDKTDEKIARLDLLLTSHHQKIQTMLVWRGDRRIYAVLKKWYEEKPIFENDKVQIFRHK